MHGWLTSLEERQNRALVRGAPTAPDTTAISTAPSSGIWLHCSVGPEIPDGEADDDKVQVRPCRLPVDLSISHICLILESRFPLQLRYDLSRHPRGRANRVATLSRKEESSPIAPAAPPPTQDGTNLRRSERIKKSARGVRSPPASNVRAPPPRPARATRPPPTGEASPAAEVMPMDATSPPGNATADTGKNTSLVDASPNDAEALADTCAVYSLGSLEFTNTNPSGIPPKVVTKDSWPVRCSIELETYSTSSGQLGLPVLWWDELVSGRKHI